MFALKDSTITIEDNCQFHHNAFLNLFTMFEDVDFYISDATMTDNSSIVLDTSDNGSSGYFKNCVFNNNVNAAEKDATFEVRDNELTFYDCDLGDSTFDEAEDVTFVGTNAPNGVGSLFGEGSLTMIVSILALVASVAAIGVSISSNKKKSEPASKES